MQTGRRYTVSKSVLDLTTGSIRQIYRGSPVSNIIFDQAGDNVAFTTNDSNGLSLWYCQSSFSSAIILLENNQLKAVKNIAVNSAWDFSEDGKRLYFTLPPKNLPYGESGSEPDIWSYQDQIIFPEFKQKGFQNILEHLATVDVTTAKVNELLFDHEQRVNYSTKHHLAQFVMNCFRYDVPYCRKNAEFGFYTGSQAL
ncbi:hypothetical protein SAMN05216436_1362 [bacterium A37T11]|nr:hypothetical protein SAMN05216436_1362 [bacterium A37T11]